MSTRSSVIIVAGPTASGKSDFAEYLADNPSKLKSFPEFAHLEGRFRGEVVNADSVQMFTNLNVGTAKPDWRNKSQPHHLFDICDHPVDFDVAQYKEKIQSVVREVIGRGNVPILVGGSLFYIKSLFYPPRKMNKSQPADLTQYRQLSDDALWKKLQAIDSIRAQQIHPHDRYRVERALMLWQQHAIKPSELRPRYEPFFDARLFFIAPPLDVLYQRINARTIVMIEKMGWIDEARQLYADTKWRDFIIRKNFIGYPELFSWIASGEPADELPEVIEAIQRETRRYAKRQRTFWKSFCTQLASESYNDVCVSELLSNNLEP